MSELDPFLDSIPADVLFKAHQVANYMDMNFIHGDWELGGLASRKLVGVLKCELDYEQATTHELLKQNESLRSRIQKLDAVVQAARNADYHTREGARVVWDLIKALDALPDAKKE